MKAYGVGQNTRFDWLRPILTKKRMGRKTALYSFSSCVWPYQLLATLKLGMLDFIIRVLKRIW
jgi:hypothetical protein